MTKLIAETTLEGKCATIRGLKNKSELNGIEVEVIIFDDAKRRFVVALPSGKRILIKQENLVPRKLLENPMPANTVGELFGSVAHLPFLEQMQGLDAHKTNEVDMLRLFRHFERLGL